MKEGGEEIEGDEIGMKRQKGERRIDNEKRIRRKKVKLQEREKEIAREVRETEKGKSRVRKRSKGREEEI